MDMDGVLVREEQVIPGAVEFLGRLQERAMPFMLREPIARPSPIVNTASPRFQAIVANSSRRARRCSRTRSALWAT